MPKLTLSGPVLFRLKSLASLNRIGLVTLIRHAFGQRLAPDWDANFEIGIRFWRHQFKAAMTQDDIARGRLLLNSLLTETDDCYEVVTKPSSDPNGTWYYPNIRRCSATLLYLHGGGYAFNGAVNDRFAAMLAHHIGAPLFAPDYRLTPEHPHPAQAEDAFGAWRYLVDRATPNEIVVIGDSAGGHMALMLLQTLKSNMMEQPALCVALCPWTDIGDSGASLHENDWYDLVQGWMALRFGEWLDPDGAYGRIALSPAYQDFNGLAPIYIQAGGREVLRDMIIEFARTQATKGADVMLDIWPDMPHDFQAYDSLKKSSANALNRISTSIKLRLGKLGALEALPGITVVPNL